MARKQYVSAAKRKKGEADNYITGFTGLRMIGCDEYVSFECSYRGDDRAGVVTAAVKLLREQWDKA